MKNSIFTVILLLLLGLSLNLNASEHRETAEYKDVLQKVQSLVKTAGPSEILVVFDIDNTLLRMNTPLGSEQWVDWQIDGMIKKAKDPNPNPPNKYDYVVADSREELLKIWGMLLYFNSTSPTQTDLAEIFSKIQSLNVSTIVMTARGPADHDYTLRELHNNNLFFEKTALPPTQGFAGSYLPYDLNKLSEVGITPEEAEKLKLKEKPIRKVQYNEGVYLTEGQHKGLMLRVLLAKAKKQYKHIIFIDNAEVQTTRVQEMFLNTGVDLTTIRYTRMDPEKQAFEKGSKVDVINKWKTLKKTLEKIFGCCAALTSIAR